MNLHTHDPQADEDAAQAAYLAAWRKHHPHYADHAEGRAWLLLVIILACLGTAWALWLWAR